MDMDFLHLTGLVSTSKVARGRDGGDGVEGGTRGRGYLDTYDQSTLLYSRNEYNIVKQLYSNFKINYKTK